VRPEAVGPRGTDTWLQLRRDPQFVLSLLALGLLAAIAVAPGLFGAGDPYDCALSRSLFRPSAGHWFGFDIQGCDYYTQTLLGTRNSLSIGILVVACAVPIGLALGSLVGYYQGVVDVVMSRATDIFFAVPLVLGGAVILAFVPGRGVEEVTLVLVLLGWPPLLRLVRSTVLVAKREPYVEAARALGATDLRILRRHILPNAIWPTVVYATVYVGVAITAEALLSFMGVGLQLPTVSWGLMLARVQHRILQAPHLLFPGAFLAVTVGAFVLLGEALRRAFNPEAR
jgi:ABC-type dipeptide/oligopeptide/nickel transport system permease subunit